MSHLGRLGNLPEIPPLDSNFWAQLAPLALQFIAAATALAAYLWINLR